MKRIRCILLAVTILLSATACGAMTEGNTPDSPTEPTNETVQTTSMTDTWAAQEIDVPDIGFFPSVRTAGDMVLLSGYDNEYTYQTAVLYNAADGSQSSPFHCMEQSSESCFIEVQTVLPTDSGYVVVYRKRINQGNFLAEGQYFAETYDKNWQYQSETDITGCLTEDRDMTAIAQTADGYCFIESAWGGADLRFTDCDWNRTGKLAGSVNDDAKLFTAADGTLYLCTEKEIQRIDTQSMSAEKVHVEGLPSKELKGACAGQGDTVFYVYDKEGVYAVSADMQAEMILDWNKSGFVGNYVIDVQMLPDGNLCMSCYGDSEGIWLLTPRSQGELNEMKTITVASVMENNSLTEELAAYSRSVHGIKFEVKDYSSYYDENAGADKCIEAFERDLLSGDIPDIICTQSLPYRKYINKNIFEDLYSWMEQDETFRKEDYLMNFFESMEDEGHLYKFSDSFRIYTVTGKTEFVGEKEGLTVGEYNTLAASIPADMQFVTWPSNWSVFSDLCMSSLDFFVDREKATCCFESPEMIEMLTFCNSFPADRSVWGSDEAHTFDDDTRAFWNNEVCLYTFGISTPGDFHIMLSEYFKNEPVTMIGYPTPDGETNGANFNTNNTLAMYSGSEYKEEIWEYFKYRLSEETQEDVYNFPVNRNALQKKMDSAINVEENPATQEEMDRLMTYIGNIRSTTEYDSTISNICLEESEMYFAGDQTAEKAVKNIQSRVSIYLAEQS